MRNKRKRFWALMLCVAMVLGLASCGQSVENSSEQSSAAEDSSVDSSVESTGEVTSEDNDREPITITWGLSSGYLTAGEGVLTEKFAVLQEIKDRFNIEIDLVAMDQDKFTLLASTGDLPDICALQNSDALRTLVDNNQVLDLTTLLEEKGQNILNRGGASLEVLKETYGGIYCLPVSCIDGLNVSILNCAGMNLYIRMDLYQEMGSPEMNNEDELIEVLKQMQEQQREATGDDGIYGVSVSLSAKVLNRLQANYGVAENQFYGSGFDAITGELSHLYTDSDSAWWKGVNFLNKCWKAGILDPESFTQDAASVKAKVKSGQALCSAATSGTQPDTEVCGENAIMALPLGAFEYAWAIYGTPAPFGTMANMNSRIIPSTCEYPERVIELLNWLDSPDGGRTWANGIQGVDWEYDENGQPVFIGEMAAAFEQGLDVGNEYLNTKVLPFYDFYVTAGQQPFDDGYSPKVTGTEKFAADNSPANYVNFAQSYGSDYYYPGQVYYDLVEAGELTTVLDGTPSGTKALMAVPSDEAVAIANSVNGMIDGKIANVIMAEDFAGAQADLLKEMSSLGMEKCDAEVLANYEVAAAKYKELFSE